MLKHGLKQWFHRGSYSWSLAFFLFLIMPAEAADRIRMETSLGVLEVELFNDQAPLTVANFLAYVDSGYYDGLIFHRVIPGFMIQGGGFKTGLERVASHAPVRNEADNGLANNKYTLAMARTSDPHSATGQFFINVVDNDFLNHQSKSPQGWGYAVFGQVVDGMKVVDRISVVRTGVVGRFGDVPLQEVLIIRAIRLP